MYSYQKTLDMIAFYQRLLLTATDRLPIIARINELQSNLREF
jgi:hypothetical protein